MKIPDGEAPGPRKVAPGTVQADARSVRLLLALTSLVAALPAGARSPATEPAAAASVSTRDVEPSGFVDLKEYVPGLVVELRYATADNFVGQPIDGYEAPRALANAPTARALRSVQEELGRHGLGLKLFDAYRPQRAILHFIRWARDPAPSTTAATHHPGLRKPELFEQGYLNLQSSHARGSAVDVTLIRIHANTPAEELDLGTPFDFFGPAAAPDFADLTPEQRRNRDLLRQMMERHGFVGSEREWWHFSLRDEPDPETAYDFPIR